MERTTTADETWALGAAAGPRRVTARPGPVHHVRDLLLAVAAAVLLAVGGGVVMTGGLMSSDPAVPTVGGTAEP
ncbi:hypothetical protein GXB85_05275 [Cellulomonas sp. APG4]|uniref:hypothetical protein n=1 Tax=Cellulomonas sp. APG4 TaxID=1538656 RepID=UPI00137A1DF0|nr:hypothetical protein [Cellulomonas sp. APG4]NCT90362.1 hypothetical protein [Cellulomonas sp. APG4]